jgi:hypothetical protein
MSKAKINLFLALSLLVFVSLACGLGKKTTTTSSTNNNTTTATSNTKATKPPTTSGDDGTTTGVEKTKPAAGKGNVQGKVMYNDKPVEGIEVTLCEKFSTVLGIQCTGKTFKTKTDAEGIYVLANADPKLYEGLMAKVYNTNLYIFPREGVMTAQKFTVEADKTIFARDINLFKGDLKVTAPKAGSKVDANALNITWNEYPDADYYKVSTYPEAGSNGVSVMGERVDGTSYTVDKQLSNSKYYIKIEAFNSNDRKLAESSADVKFTVTGGADPATATK